MGDMAKQFQEIITGHESTESELKDFLAVVRLFDQRLLAENMAAAFRSHQYLLAVKRRGSGDNGDLGADPLKEFLRAPVAREAVICGVTPSFDHGGLRLRQVGSPGHQK